MKKNIKPKSANNKGIQYKQWKKKAKEYIYTNIFGLAIIILLGIIIYYNSFNCSFQLDDRTSILEKSSIRNLFDVKAIWNSSQTRFLPLLSFAINYHFGEYNVWGYHLINLIIHLINSCLVYWLTFLILSSPAIKLYKISDNKIIIALFTALLFVSHPLATQSVTYIVQRMASMVTLFYLLSLALYMKARLSHERNIYNYSLFAGSIISAILAMLSKENAFTLPFAIVLVEIFFFQTKRISLNFKDYRVVLLIVGLLGFILAILFKFSFNIFEPLSPAYQNDFRTITSLNYLFTQFSVIVKYIQLLFLPLHLNLDYDFAISNSFFEPRTIISFLTLLSLILLAIFFLKKNRIISFGIFWFFLTLSIESSIIPIDDLIFEHRTYLPSFGFFLILSSGIYVLLWKKYKNLVFAILAGIILFNSYLTYERNKVWKDELTLWNDVLLKSPNKARPYNNRGMILLNTERYEDMLKDFNKAIELQPGFVEAYNNRGIVFMKAKRNRKALSNFNKAIELGPNYANAYYNRGIIFENERKIDQAKNDYSKAIELNPNYIKAYVNRGNLFRNEMRYDEAIRDYEKAIELNTDFAKAYYNRGKLLMLEKKFDDAIADFSKVISLKSDDLKAAYYDRGMSFLFIGATVKACTDLQEGSRLDNQLATDSYNRYCQ